MEHRRPPDHLFIALQGRKYERTLKRELACPAQLSRFTVYIIERTLCVQCVNSTFIRVYYHGTKQPMA